jgi:hypothetical protein
LPLADRLILWASSLQLPFSLLSLGHEALFLCLFSALLFVYARIQHLNDKEFWANQQLIGSKREKEKSEGNGFMNGFKGDHFIAHFISFN